MDRRTVVVTGASAGIGRATARIFAERGADVALLARSEVGLEEIASDIRGLGRKALPLPTDVADAEAVEKAAGEVEEHLGPIDVWVNNAMVTVFSRVADMDADEYRRVTEVTYLGTVHGTLSALRRMRPRNRGTIVQVGSALAYRSIPLQSAYCAAKHAALGFTDSLRTELIHEESDIHLTMVHLPAVNTPQFDWSRSHMERRPQPVPPIYQPEVAADAIEWASRQRRREVWVGFPAVYTIVGQRVAAWFLDWYLGKTGFTSQQTNKSTRPDRPDNLYDTVDSGLHRTHGRFDARSKDHSWQMWANKRRGILAALGGLALAPAAWRMLSDSD